MNTTKPIPRRRPQHPGGFTRQAARQAARQHYVEALDGLVHGPDTAHATLAGRRATWDAYEAYTRSLRTIHNTQAERARLNAAIAAHTAANYEPTDTAADARRKRAAREEQPR